MNSLLFVKDKLLPRADIPGQVENSQDRADFTVTNHHHTKLFVSAHLVRQEHPHEVNSNEPNATARSTFAQQEIPHEKQRNEKTLQETAQHTSNECSHLTE